MAKYSIEGSTLTNIADAIRAKTGSTAKITPETMGEAVNGIQTGASIDTCSITLSGYKVGSSYVGYVATCFVDGKIVVKSATEIATPSVTITDIVCGSIFCATCDDPMGIDFSDEIEDYWDISWHLEYGAEVALSALYIAPTEAGAHGTIVFEED